MAWNFGVQINSLTQFDANLDSASEEGDDFTTLANQWLNDAAKEVISLMPANLKQKCAQLTVLNNAATTMDLDGVGDVLQVTRKNADSGYHMPCRKIPGAYGDASNDSTNMMYYATATDPVYWTTSNSSDAATLFVKPTPTANQTANVYHITYPTVDHAATSIDNFPDEAEHLVALRAAITAAQYKLNFEEDIELYGGIITTLKAQYTEGVQAMKAGEITPLQQGK
jgi:hypothetical protein|tara:strand:- start:112 stop:789 length:678 start_codon:yes stop_codon:yes gene_type:complete